MGVYDRQIASTKRKIAAKGRACVWKQPGGPSYVDPDRPWLGSTQTPDAYNVSILFIPEGGNAAFLRMLTGSDVKVGEDYGLMHDVPFMPTDNGLVYDATGETLLRTVTAVTPFAPNGDIIFYTVRFAAQVGTQKEDALAKRLADGTADELDTLTNETLPDAI